jgi:hypothetical protein
MQTFHFRLNDDFCIFIEKRGGSYFQLWGHRGVVYAPGKYVDAAIALREMDRLRSDGYEEQVGAVSA